MSGLFMVAHQPVTEVPFETDASTIVQVEGVLGRIGQSEDILPKTPNAVDKDRQKKMIWG
jgi:hypothetical protein